jgi:hypothetical protein
MCHPEPHAKDLVLFALADSLFQFATIDLRHLDEV